MAKPEDNIPENHGRRNDGEAVVAESGQADSDAAQDSTETEIVTSVVEESGVEGSPIQIDHVFSILKNQRRRAVLRYVQTVEEEVSVGELADQIAAWECEKEPRAITSQERKRVYVALYQNHLPKMDDVGAISYNKSRGKIKPGENRHLFERYLPTETNNTERVWTKVYGLLPFVFGLFGFVNVLVLHQKPVSDRRVSSVWKHLLREWSPVLSEQKEIVRQYFHDRLCVRLCWWC